MRIRDLLAPESIQLNGSATGKEDVLNQMVSLMVKSGKIADEETYRKGVFAREEESTTGIGEGIAIPHCKSAAVKKPGLSAMVLKDGVDFDALDGEKVHLIFLIAAPDTEDNVHLDVLSRLSVLLMDENFTNGLKQAASVEEFLKVIDEAESEKEEKEEQKETERKEPEVNQKKILAVTGCPTGIEDGLYINGHVTGNSPYLTFEWKAGKDGEHHEVKTQLIGEYNFANALAAVTIGHFFDVESGKIDTALKEYTPQNNRSQLKQTADNTLIIDAYNANPTSMQASISNFHNMEIDNKMLILGDMRELGKDGPKEHQKIVDFLTECGFKDVMLVGEQFAAARHDFPTYPDAPAVIEALQKNKPHGKTILIKGSNGIKLSTVIDYL